MHLLPRPLRSVLQPMVHLHRVMLLVEVLQDTIHKMELEQVQELMDKVFLVEMEAEVTTQVVVVVLA